MAIKYSKSFSKSFSAALENGMIHIYTGSPPKLSRTTQYTFKTSSPEAIDYELIRNELSRKNPLAIIHRDDGYHRAIVHDSIVKKLCLLHESNYDIRHIFTWRKTEKGNVSEIISLIKKIKNTPWPKKKETTFKVDIIKI